MQPQEWRNWQWSKMLGCWLLHWPYCRVLIKMGFHKQTSMTYHPQTNTVVNRINCTIKMMLATFEKWKYSGLGHISQFRCICLQHGCARINSVESLCSCLRPWRGSPNWSALTECGSRPVAHGPNIICTNVRPSPTRHQHHSAWQHQGATATTSLWPVAPLGTIPC